MDRIAVFPGSFDPITRGHESIIRRALPMFDRIIVAIGHNTGKSHYFSLEEREAWIRTVFKDEAAIQTTVYEGLTVDFCRKSNARFIIRGLRTSADFEFERGIAHINRQLEPSIETIFLLANQEYNALNSSIVREVHRFGGDIRPFIPEGIIIPKPKG